MKKFNNLDGIYIVCNDDYDYMNVFSSEKEVRTFIQKEVKSLCEDIDGKVIYKEEPKYDKDDASGNYQYTIEDSDGETEELLLIVYYLRYDEDNGYNRW